MLVKLAPYSSKTCPYLFSSVFQSFQLTFQVQFGRALWNSIIIYSTSQMIVTKIPKHSIFLLKSRHHILVKPFYVRLGTCSKCSIVVPCTTRRVLSGGVLSSSIRQSKIFETVDVAMEHHQTLA